jgi:pyrroline-5-carboxylate reductase
VNETCATAFIGGGNMASALIGGLLRQGHQAGNLHVVEVDAERRARLERDFGVRTSAAPDVTLGACDVFVLAVKPQQMRDVCATLKPFVRGQLIVSVAAGIRAADLARWLGTACIVRAMPNTPALVGMGITGLAALPAATADQRAAAEGILRAVGSVVWFDDEAKLDPVTALSASGPAYVFYFIEALIRAGREMGFSDAQARQLAIETVVGAAHLARDADEPPEVLRARVTSRGGTTAAAIASLEAAGFGPAVVAAVFAACRRAVELGDEFGRD